MNKNFRTCFLLFLIAFMVVFLVLLSCAPAQSPDSQKVYYQQYMDFFEEIYETMQDNYFYPVNRNDFDRFIDTFNQEIYGRMDRKDQWDEFVNLRSGAFLVEFLRTPEDRFSALFPSQMVDEFQKEVLGKKIDLGLYGEKTLEGYLLSRVEPRSNAYQKGIRPGDLLVSIDQVLFKELNEEEIGGRLTPLEGSIVRIVYEQARDKLRKTIDLVCEEYFHQTIFPVSIPVEDVYCLKVERFNQKTAEDLFNFIAVINQQKPSGLILDLRGNPGGPPLAAREIASFFLSPDQEFVYFQRKNQEKNYLTVPNIPKEYRYVGPMVILVDQDSGSASELFSGVMQKENRAVLMGVNTAGQVFLKSMLTLKNEAMLLLVTARGHYPDGEAFSFHGLTPQYRIGQADQDLVLFAAGYLRALMDHKIDFQGR